ncbi:MAG: RNA methyltransferase [Bacteroidales bacterium]|nr:RNA methyltransferase [Bacteroidales bacterium]
MKKLTMLEMGRMTTSEFKESEKMPLVIVLDNIRSLNNIGSVFRTSDAFRVESIYLCGISATPPSPEIHKTALGAEDSVDWQYFEDTHEAVKALQERGYRVMAIEQCQGSTMLDTWQAWENEENLFGYGVVMGNEVKGVQQSVVDMCDGCLEIPQFGTKHSLNVSVTTGLVIWDFFKQFKKLKNL